MSETKPPDTPTGFIDLFFDQTEFADPVGRVTKERAMKQLAQLRAKAAAYDNVMQELHQLPELNMSNYSEGEVGHLNAGVNKIVRDETAAKRFTP